MGEDITYGNASLFNVPTDYSSGIPKRQAASPVEEERLKFGDRNKSSEELVLKYDSEKDGRLPDKSGIWNTPTSGLQPGKHAWRSPADVQKLSRKARWKTFTSGTTFHGIRYIFEESHYSLRR